MPLPTVSIAAALPVTSLAVILIPNTSDETPSFSLSLNNPTDTQGLIINIFGLGVALAAVIIALFQLQKMRTTPTAGSQSDIEIGKRLIIRSELRKYI
jgi:hypothetical protein